MSSAAEARITGVSSLLAKLGGRVQNVVFVTISDQLAEGAMAIHRDAVKSIQAHVSSDHRAVRYNPKRTVDVSAPGNPPNSDRGTLAQSVSFDIDTGRLEATVGTNLKYGAYLEMGTAKMEARPWLFPAFEAHRAEIKSNVSRAIQDALKGVSR